MNQSAINSQLPTTHFAVTAELVRSFAAVLGDQDLPDPPTLATCFGVWANPAWLAALHALGAPLERMLHGEEEYSYHAALRPGTTISAEATIADVREKHGQRGTITLITLATSFRDAGGDLLVEGRTVIVLRG